MRKPIDRFHYGRKTRDRAGAKIITVGKAARQNNGVEAGNFFGLVPDEFNRLADDRADGMIGVIVAIRAGKLDHAELHEVILPHSKPVIFESRSDHRRDFDFGRRRGLPGRDDFRARLRGFAFEARAISRRRAAAHPGLLTWRPRARASASAGKFSVMVETAAKYAPWPTRTGATSAVSLPMKTLLPILV